MSTGRWRAALAERGRALVDRWRRMLWLDRSSYERAAHYRLRLALLGLQGGLFLVAPVAFWASGSRALALAAPLAMIAGVGVVLGERLTSLLYDCPLPSSAMERSFLARHPWIMLFVAVVLHMGTIVSREAFLAGRALDAPVAIETLTFVLLTLTGVPAWLWLLHPLRVLRQAGALVDEERPGLRRRWRVRWRSLRDGARSFHREVIAPLWEAWRRHRTGGSSSSGSREAR